MAKTFQVSIPERDKELSKWLEERIEKNEISPSDLFQDALKQHKAEYDIMHAVSSEHLMKKIKNLEQTNDQLRITLKNQTSFIHSKNLQEDFFAFVEELAKNPPRKEVQQ